MALRGILHRMKSEDPIMDEHVDYVELEGMIEKSGSGKMIKIVTLNDFSDVEIIQRELRNGNIVWVRMKPLKDKDMIELKRAIDRLRKTCVAVNGDIAGIDEDYLVVSPDGVKIHRA